MKFFPDSTTFISFGSLQIKWYAITMLTGAFLAYLFSLRNFKKNGYKQEVVDDLFFGCFLFGIIGARIWYVLFSDLSYYLSNPIRILFIFEGGLAIQGGIFLGTLYGYLYTKKRKMSFLRAADAVVPNLLIAQAVGRWGNFINKEAYGNIVSEAFYNNFPTFIKEGMFIDGFYRQPTFLWESLLNILGFIIICFVLKKYRWNKRGDLVYRYLIWYGITRLIVEGYRTDSLMFMNLRMAQLISILFIFVGVLGIFNVFNKFIKKEEPVIILDLKEETYLEDNKISENFKDIYKQLPSNRLVLISNHKDEEITCLSTTDNKVEEACKLFNVRHDECIYVSDLQESLIEAKKMGVYTVALVTSGQNNLNIETNSIIYNLLEIKALKKEDEKSWTYNMM